MMEASLCLGSNADGASTFIDAAVAFIETVATVHTDSGRYLSDPEKVKCKELYTNRILLISTDLDYKTLHNTLKSYETNQRLSHVQEERVTIDIDIVVYDGAVIRPVDYQSAYFRKGLLLIMGL